MSIRLPVIDAKASNVYHYPNTILYNQETPFSDDLSTESGQTLGIDKNHSLLNSNTNGSFPHNLEGARRLETSFARSLYLVLSIFNPLETEFLPSILGNTSQMVNFLAFHILIPLEQIKAS